MLELESGYQDLISNIDIEISPEEHIQLDEAIFEECSAIEEEMTDVFSSLTEDPLQSISLIEESRETVCESAGNYIRTEQLRQSRQYDKKVIENRYNKILYLFIHLLSPNTLDATLRKVMKTSTLILPK